MGIHEWEIVCSLVEARLQQIEMPVDKNKYYTRTKSCPLGFLIRVEGYEIHQVSRRASPPLPPTKMGDKIFNIYFSWQRTELFKEINNTKSTLRWTAGGSMDGRKDKGAKRQEGKEQKKIESGKGDKRRRE